MVDQRTMAQLLQAPTEGYKDAIVVPAITADNFELKNGLLTLVQNKQFFRHDKEDLHAHIRYFNNITSTLKFPNIPNTSIKLMIFPFSLKGAARIWIKKEPPRSIFTWDDLVSKFINQFFPPSKTKNLRNEITNFQQHFDESFSEAWDRFKDLLRACPHHGFSELHQLDTFYNALNSKDQDSLNSADGVVAKVSMNTSTSGISPDVVELKDMVKALLLDKKSKNQAPATVKAVEESCPVFEHVIALVSAPMPNPKSLIKYPSRRNDERNREKANNQIEKFYQIFKDMSFEISFGNALILMPKFSSTLKALIRNKEKLSEMARTSLNEHCLGILLKKLQKKLRDPGKFLIPCDFLGIDECLALEDLGASINLMPLSMWKILSLPELTPTCVTFEFVDRSISRLIGVAEDVYVKVRKFHFPADFVVVDFDTNPRVPLILGRSFLKTGRALIDVFKGELTLRVGKEAITFNLDQTSRYSANYNEMTAKRIDVIDMACEDDFLLEKVDAFLTLEDDHTSPKVDQSYLDSKGDILLLEAILNDDQSLPLPNQALKLTPHHEYAFLEGNDKLPVIIVKDLSIEKKTALRTVLKSHKQAIAWKLSDINGIDPEFCTHKIHMEEDFEPAGQHQRS
nr:reverse transcriptase domain-containing protein [Tanacetum cinerariifolium]